jgi:hypothetical protein
MKHNTLSIVAICATMAACSNSEKVVTNRVELPGKIDNEAFTDNIESITVMNLQMDDNWTFADYPRMAGGDNYIYLLDDQKMQLSCFDRQTGEKVSSRIIKGNGPGEIVGMSTMFCNGDTLCIQDFKGVVSQYNHKCAFLGKLYELDEEHSYYNVLRFGNKNYVLFTTGGGSEQPALVTDKQFNILSRHFSPQERHNTLSSGVARPYYSNDDTVRGFLAGDNRIFELCGETEGCIELVVPNPLPQEVMQQATSGAIDFQKVFEYDGMFGNLTESGRFISFVYNCDRNRYTSLLDKRTNSVVSIPADGGTADNATGIFVYFFNRTTIFQTDGKFIYAKTPSARMAELIEGHDDALDERLKATQASYRAYLERNAEYMKDLEPEERDAAAVLLKIKLKD